jgi:hypothetical protein
VKGNELEATSAAGGRGPQTGERRMNAAGPSVSNLDLRLEHEFQTVMARQRSALPQFLSIAHGIGAILFQKRFRLCNTCHARGHGCPLP